MSEFVADLRRTAYAVVSPLRASTPFWSALRWAYRHTAGGVRPVKANGLLFAVNPADNGIGQKLALSGTYGEGRSQIIDRLVKAGDVALDVGANIGFYTMQLARAVGRSGTVIAVEPDTRNLELLRQSVELNKFENIRVVASAVAIKPGKGTLFRTDSYADNALVADRVDGVDGAAVDSIPVEIRTLDEIVARNAIKEVNFVKIDIDGSEPLALQGMRQTIAASKDIKIIAEYTPGNLVRYVANPIDMISMVEELGMRLELSCDNDTGELVRELDRTMKILVKLQGAETRDLLFVKRT